MSETSCGHRGCGIRPTKPEYVAAGLCHDHYVAAYTQAASLGLVRVLRAPVIAYTFDELGPDARAEATLRLAEEADAAGVWAGPEPEVLVDAAVRERGGALADLEAQWTLDPEGDPARNGIVFDGTVRTDRLPTDAPKPAGEAVWVDLDAAFATGSFRRRQTVTVCWPEPACDPFEAHERDEFADRFAEWVTGIGVAATEKVLGQLAAPVDEDWGQEQADLRGLRFDAVGIPLTR